MQKQPFDIIHCSWPQPVEQHDGIWTSEPEWDAPLMPVMPQPQWESINGEPCWTIDWCQIFAAGVKRYGSQCPGEMRGFHIVFHLVIKSSGTLVFWDDDGCLIRRNGEIIHADRTSHPLERSEINVCTGDRLEVAQWQYYGSWKWGARLIRTGEIELTEENSLLAYLDAVWQRLEDPNGPPLKMYFSGNAPICTVLSIYSMILNGYSPEKVFVFGEYQWSEQSRKVFAKLLPFTQIVPTEAVLEKIQSFSVPRLVELAQNYWSVMKVCIGLLYPPKDYCFMDDDIFILEGIDDALSAFQNCNFVFAPDADYSNEYLTSWGSVLGKNEPLRTGRVNTGLYLLRNNLDPKKIADDILRVTLDHMPVWQWEQGFIATQFAEESIYQLPSQSYFYPYFDGLPGGMLNYDYKSNPCSFVSIHFGGLIEKPSDIIAIRLAPEILRRNFQ